MAEFLEIASTCRILFSGCHSSSASRKARYSSASAHNPDVSSHSWAGPLGQFNQFDPARSKGFGNRACTVGASIIDHQDFIDGSSLSENPLERG